MDCTGADIKISSIKFVQHGAVEGILSKFLGILCYYLFQASKENFTFPGRYSLIKYHSRVCGRLISYVCT